MGAVEAPAILPVLASERDAELVRRARTRARLPLAVRTEHIAYASAAVFAAVAAVELLTLPPVRPLSPLVAAVAVLVYAIVGRVEFEVGNMLAYAAELAFVPMLFVLPPRTVPLLVGLGLVLGNVPDLVRGRLGMHNVPVLVYNGSYALGPAAVLAVAGEGAPTWGHVPLYLGALGAQLAVDGIASSVWSRLAWSIGLGEHLRSLRVTAFVDATLAPVALSVAIAAHGSVWALLPVVPLALLLRVFSRERQLRIDNALELSSAYRGTALLLGDVIEADDAYTGSHSRAVVDLSLAVADRLGLDPAERRGAELAALLHDIGKVKIPPEILNKPGPLDEEERALMNTHTIIGQAMLETIGGLLGKVGEVVRSCHERWDGGGYPDGLAGDEIPLIARIVCVCDAWNAMTTDRVYRPALHWHVAVEELRACSGKQFDPAVVAALLDVLGED